MTIFRNQIPLIMIKRLMQSLLVVSLGFLFGCTPEAPTTSQIDPDKTAIPDSTSAIASATDIPATPMVIFTDTDVPATATKLPSQTPVPATATVDFTGVFPPYTDIQVEQITFSVSQFRLVGDLQIPDSDGRSPVIIMVHGSGNSDRYDWGKYQPIMDRFLHAGYAVFSWDKPGTGESTGQLSYYADVIAERAEILLEAIETIKSHPSIDPGMIGVWGISQAGYVIPWTLMSTDAIAFMILISGPAMDSYDQGAYLIGQVAYCFGSSQEEADVIEELISNVEKATTYQEYLENVERLNEHLSDADFGLSRDIIPESEWEPEDVNGLAFFNPIEVIEQTTIPVLAVFGELDRQVDPFQGAQAYMQALLAAGHEQFHVELIPGVDHVIVEAETGCFDEQMEYSRAQSLGYPQAYLDLLETWVRQLRDPLE